MSFTESDADLDAAGGKQINDEDMDDLDAVLFGKKPKAKSVNESQKSTPAANKKRVSFSGPKSPEINLDDPLEGLLSSDDDDDNLGDYTPSSLKPNTAETLTTLKQLPEKKSAPKTPTAAVTPVASKKTVDDDDDLFGDDDDDDLLDSDKEEKKSKEPAAIKTQPAPNSVLDELLGTKSSVRNRPTSGSTVRSLRFDKEGNFIKDKDELTSTPQQQSKFGAYQPSVGSGGGVSANRKSGSRRGSNASAAENNDTFFDFLKDESTPKPQQERVGSAKASAGRRDARPSSAPAPQQAQQSAVRQLDLSGKEMDIDSILSGDNNVNANKSMRPMSSGNLRTTPALTQENDLNKTTPVRSSRRTTASKANPTNNNNDDEFLSAANNNNTSSAAPSNGRRKPPPSPAAGVASPVTDKPPQPTPKRHHPPLNNNNTTESSLIDDLLNNDSRHQHDRHHHHHHHQQQMPQHQQIPTPMTNLADDITAHHTPQHRPHKLFATNQPPAGASELRTEARIQALESQIGHMKALLHEAELGYHADRELAQQAHDGRVELLQRSLADIRTRSQREIEAIRESYACRLEAMRAQVAEHTQAEARHDVGQLEEVRRARELHAAAMHEMRADHERQVEALKAGHRSDVEALQAYGGYARNMDAMMEKTERSAERMNAFADKYDRVFDDLRRQSEMAISNNQHFVTGVEEQVRKMERGWREANTNLMESIARFDARVVDMSRRFEEHLFVLRAEQSRVAAAQASLDEERRYARDQAASEREEARRQQAEAIEQQQRNAREAKLERERLARKEHDLQEAGRARAESLRAEMERVLARERELSQRHDELTRERAAASRRGEKSEQDEQAATRRRGEAETMLARAKEREDEVRAAEERIEREYAELERRKQAENERVAESERALREAQQIKHQQEGRLRALRDLSEDVATQRKKLAEERKLVVEERMTTSAGGKKFSHHQQQLQPHDKAATVIGSPPMLEHYHNSEAYNSLSLVQPTADANAVLWKHSAQEDRHFLEGEEFYLETLKHAPYHPST